MSKVDTRPRGLPDEHQELTHADPLRDNLLLTKWTIRAEMRIGRLLKIIEQAPHAGRYCGIRCRCWKHDVIEWVKREEDWYGMPMSRYRHTGDEEIEGVDK